tara:strand:- start:6028 stop:7575 length:1548 start_codon:yes stop_codon:yes gene_type:complete
MSQINRIIIVGGGTAGWLTAGLLAATHSEPDKDGNKLTVTVVESDTVHPIGVGEGTWPTMRRTLSKIGIPEADLIKRAGATFKQASKFVNWHKNEMGNAYYHPFSAPQGSAILDITPYWLSSQDKKGQYANDVCFQPELCEAGLAPKISAHPNQSFVANYGYHLDAGQFIDLIRTHCTQKLGVRRIVDDVISVNPNENGIGSVETRNSGNLTAELYIDCSGFSSLLIEKALSVELVDASGYIFSDRALVCQMPYEDKNSPIACYTQSTAQEAGWIWDIALQHRRGTGYVYSSKHQSDDAARDTFAKYLAQYTNAPVDKSAFREIRFSTGYRRKFWEKNCVAIGLSSGFLEPLEASSLMLIEQSATLLAEQLPANTQVMPLVEHRFNEQLQGMWESAIDFLKLHYVLSNNNAAFWKDNRLEQSIPPRLLSLLKEWQFRPILDSDFSKSSDTFSAQSYRYILYGMLNSNSNINSASTYRRTLKHAEFADKQLSLNQALIKQLKSRMPSHRGLIESFY